MIEIINRFEDNIELDNNIDYVISLKIHNTPINIYTDDAGQCYFFTYINGEEIVEQTCGAYNTDFLDYIIWTVDRKGACIYKFTEEDWEELMESRTKRRLENIDTDDYEIYTYEEIENIYTKIFEKIFEG